MSSKIFKCPKCGEVSSPSFTIETFNVGGKDLEAIVCPKCGPIFFMLPLDWEEIDENGVKEE